MTQIPHDPGSGHEARPVERLQRIFCAAHELTGEQAAQMSRRQDWCWERAVRRCEERGEGCHVGMVTVPCIDCEAKALGLPVRRADAYQAGAVAMSARWEAHVARALAARTVTIYATPGTQILTVGKLAHPDVIAKGIADDIAAGLDLIEVPR